jgi:AcrR family transcriptional regulator
MFEVSTPKRSYGGVAAAERRAQRRAALIDAALDLLGESGAGAVTKKAVCARARLNDRYFYEQFTDRDALLRSIAEELTGQGLAAVIAATLEAPADARSRVYAAAQAALDFITADRRRGQLLLVSHTDEVLAQARLVSTRAIANAMAATSREVLGEAAPDQLDTDLVSFTFVSGTLELVAAWLRGEFDVSHEHLVEVVAALLLSAADVSTMLPKAT